MRAGIILFLFSSIGLGAYPSHWWKHYPNKASWEILPSEAKKGQELILSKRNELGILSNFAATPFSFRGTHYASVEGFWQMLKYPEGPADPRHKMSWPFTRKQVAQMTGFEAKAAGDKASHLMKSLSINWVSFENKRLAYRTPKKGEHYELIKKVMWAKLRHNPKVKQVLRSTGTLRLRPDHDQGKHPPPAWRYHEIWMDIRSSLNALTE